MFSTGMKNRWPRRICLDLFCGPGPSRVRDTGRLVLGSPMIALSLPDPFDAYVFVDDNPDALEALRLRVARLGWPHVGTYIPADANAAVNLILEPISETSGEKRISFCF